MPISISLEPNKNTGSLHTSLIGVSARGETRDFSATGIGFVVSSIRVNEYYLVGEGRVLNAELNLPGGKVKMQLMGRRYKQIGEHVSTTQYLVGATILKMSENDREIYRQFLAQKKINAGSLELGIDEG